MFLALERRATRVNSAISVQTQPFGGALRILDPAGFRTAAGGYAYDSVLSSEEQDLRILIPPAAWETVREFILSQMQSNQSEMIEANPCRELEEEFLESVGIQLLPEHYSYRPVGISIQDQPLPTKNRRLPGAPTVRIYRIFEVVLHDRGICEATLERGKRFTDDDLRALAELDAARGGKGRANSVLVMPLDEARDAYRAVLPQAARPFSIRDPVLESTLAMLIV